MMVCLALPTPLRSCHEGRVQGHSTQTLCRLSTPRRLVFSWRSKQVTAWARHEFNAGSILLAKAFATGAQRMLSRLFTRTAGLKDPTFLDNVDCLVVVRSDGQAADTRCSKDTEYDAKAHRSRYGVWFAWHYAVEADSKPTTTCSAAGLVVGSR